jgi:hypothetical protein
MAYGRSGNIEGGEYIAPIRRIDQPVEKMDFAQPIVRPSFLSKGLAAAAMVTTTKLTVEEADDACQSRYSSS